MKEKKRFYLYNAKNDTTVLLAPREIECIIYILRGKTSKQIARMLELSHRTVEFYISRLKNKLYCHTKSELIEKILSGKLINEGELGVSVPQIIQEHHQVGAVIKKLEHGRKRKKEKVET